MSLSNFVSQPFQEMLIQEKLLKDTEKRKLVARVLISENYMHCPSMSVDDNYILLGKHRSLWDGIKIKTR
jgi:hypothetical protein